MIADPARLSAGLEPPLPSARVWVAAVALLLQGLVPFVFAEEHPAAIVALVVNAILCVGLAWAVWEGKRWALMPALVFIAVQVPTISTPFCAWESYAGARFGFGIIPRLNLLDAPMFTFRSVGEAFICSTSQPSSMLLAEFHSSNGEQTFIAVNLTALLVLLPLIATKRQRDRQERRWQVPLPTPPNPALAPDAVPE